MDQPSSSLPKPSVSESPLALLTTSCIIYSAEYYPYCQQWLDDIISKLASSHNSNQTVTNVFNQLIMDLNREIVFGPNGWYVAVQNRPHLDVLDSALIREEDENATNINRQDIEQIIIENGLESLIPTNKIEELMWYKRSHHLKLHKFIHKTLTQETHRKLEVNGEFWNKCTPLPTLLLTLQNSLENLKEEFPSSLTLFLGRLKFLHNKILQNPAEELAKTSLKNYRAYIKERNHKKDLDLLSYVELLLEYANVLLFYFKYRECEEIIEFCKNIVNLEIEFTGKLGRRTKYQSFDTPQLVMTMNPKGQSSSKDDEKEENDNEIDKDAIEIPNAKELVLKELSFSNNGKETQIKQSNFDDESILLERPQFVEEEELEKKMPIQKVLVALFSIQYIWETTPKDEVLYQQVSTAMQTILMYKESFSYPVMFNALLLRSLNEFPRIKNAERALDQFEKLRANFNEITDKDLTLFYGTSFMPYGEFIKLLAGKYMEIGLTMTAIELFEKVGMIEDCIDGLIAKSYKEKALALAQKFEKENGKTPRLLCMLGDLQEGDKCVSYYNESWELSGKRNARAMRSLGWHYFREKKIDRAALSFKLATEANFYHPSTWFTLGCCYMQLNDYQKAITAFGESVCIDETQGEAWGNISSCYIYQNRFKEAYSTLEQALKYSERNWKLWANMLTVSLKIKKFYKYFECITKLVENEKSEIITPEVLSKLITIFKYQQQTSERHRITETMKRRLDKLYGNLIEKIGQNPIAWHAIYEYNIELLNYINNNYKFYKGHHESNTLPQNNILEGHQTLEETESTYKVQIEQIQESILSSKQTELNMTMKIGWDTYKQSGEDVLTVLQKYIQVFNEYGKKDEKEVNEFKVFVNGVHKKLESCLERKIELNSHQ